MLAGRRVGIFHEVHWQNACTSIVLKKEPVSTCESVCHPIGPEPLVNRSLKLFICQRLRETMMTGYHWPCVFHLSLWGGF